MSSFPELDCRALAPELHGCVEACRRCVVLLDLVSGAHRGISGGTLEALGPHVRHCLEHFQCLLRGVESGIVDYDARERDELLERDPGRLRSLLIDAASELARIEPSAIDRRLAVRQSVAPGRPAVLAETSLGRELAFLSSHAIHHVAIMAGIARDHGIDVPEELAVAYATAAHRDRLLRELDG